MDVIRIPNFDTSFIKDDAFHNKKWENCPKKLLH